MSINYREEFESLALGLDPNRYYDAWRLVVMLWRGIWWHSTTDWSRYRREIWTMFTERVVAAARTAGDLDGFLSQAARFLSLSAVGANMDDRSELARMLALPPEGRRQIMRMLREDAPVLVALLRLWRDQNKEAKELERALDEGTLFEGTEI